MYLTSNLRQFTYLAYVNFNVSVHVTSILQGSCLSFQRSCSYWQAIVSVFSWLYLSVWRPAFQFLTVFIQLRLFCISSAAFCVQTPKVPCRACIGMRQTTWSLLTCCSKCSIPTCNEAAKETVCVRDLTSDQALLATFLSLFLSTILFFSQWMGPCSVRQKTNYSCLETLACFAASPHSSLPICIAFCVQLCIVSSGRSLFITYRPSQSSLSHFSFTLLLSEILLATLVWYSLVTYGSYSHSSRSKRWSILTSWAVVSFLRRIMLVC